MLSTCVEIYLPGELREDFSVVYLTGRVTMTAMTAPRALLSARVGVEVVLVASSVPESTEVARLQSRGCHN